MFNKLVISLQSNTNKVKMGVKKHIIKSTNYES